MTNESEACTILKNSFEACGYFASKIPDPSSDYIKTIQRPFDMFAVGYNTSYYIEVKYLSSLKVFDLNHIQSHQISNLLQIKDLMPQAECWIILGVKVDRGDNRFYVFNDIYDVAYRREHKLNIKKKELENMDYVLVHKNLIDIEGLKLIKKETDK